MIKKFAFIDIGELGWSLYLSAHVRWLKRNTYHYIFMMTSPDRYCLYKGLADSIVNVPNDFHKLFKSEQDGLGLKNVANPKIREYLKDKIPSSHIIPSYFLTSHRSVLPKNKLDYKPYKYKKKLKGKREIIIFPRCRRERPFRHRNLPKKFYVDLINRLSKKFPNFVIRSVGTIQGGYNINVNRPNYINWVGRTKTIQDLMDRFQLSEVAIGSQSAPPKLALIQRIPVFMIGHQRERHEKTDNPMNTKVKFYKVPSDYEKIDSLDCINETLKFVKGCI